MVHLLKMTPAGYVIVLVAATLLYLITISTCDNVMNSCGSTQVLPRYETKQGTDIPVRVVTCSLKSQEIGEKYLFDISWALETFANVDNSTLFDVTFGFFCSSSMQLVFINPANIVNKNISLGLSFWGECKVLTQSLAVWTKATEFRVIGLNGEKSSISGFTNQTLATHFKEISYIVSYNSRIENLPGMFTDTKNVFPNMEGIDFRNMSISKIPRQWKFTMPLLQYLGLHDNNLTQPPQFPWNNSTLEIFRGLKRTDYYADSYGVHVEKHIYIRGLELGYNKIEDLSSHEFRGFLHLLRLQGNGLKTVGPSCFRKLEGIQTIDLSRNKLTSLPENLFQGLSSLLNILLGKNNISAIDQKLFKGLEKIRRIYLNDNNLKYIPDGLFNSLNTMEVLRLNGNKITKIEENPFSKHCALRWLFLQNNKLSSIPSWIFHLSKIEVIDLSSNELSFQDLDKALEGFDLPTGDPLDKDPVLLNLGNNNIRTLIDPAGLDRLKGDKGPFWFSKYGYLWKAFVIKLTGNPLVCDCIMWAVAKEIRNILEARPDIRPRFATWLCDWPQGLKNQLILEIEESQWMQRKDQPKNCPAECFCQQRCSDDVVVVYCEKKNLTKVPSSMPQGRIELNLRNNEIKDIPAYSFLSNVTAFKLTNNKVEQLQASVVQKLQCIKILLIDSNKLTSLPREIETMNFTTLALDQNLFKCDCTTKWMKHWLLKNKHRIRNIEKVLCNSANTLGKAMYSLPDNEFICNTPIEKPNPKEKMIAGTIVASVLGGLLFMILIIAFLMYKYHREVKVFMFTHFNWHRFDRIDDSDPSKIYDAFLSYSKDDLPWVVDTLLRRLEDHNPPYKICFHHRDFLAGAPIEENILKSVDQSKRMLMVLSPTFARSEWCLLEFRAAHRKVLEDRMNYLIIILFDDVDVSELDDEIKLYMRTNTYVSISDRWFWQKLFYAMPQHQSKESAEERNENVAAKQDNLAETMQEIERAMTCNNRDTILLV